MEMKKYKLSEVALHITDGEHNSVIDDENGEYFLLSNKNIVDGNIVITKNDRKISKETFDKINKRTKLNKNDLVISTVGTLGKLAIIKDVPNYEFQRSVGIIKLNQNVSDIQYVYYFLQQDYIQRKLTFGSSGAIQKCIFISQLNDISVGLPDLPTQKSIAKVLTDIDAKIALNKKINKELEAMAKELYDYWFVQFDFPNENGKPYKSSGGKMIYSEVLKREIPEGWEVKRLRSCLNHINTGLNPRDNFKLGNGDIKYITVKNLTKDGVIDFTGCDLIDEEACALVHERSQITKGDILFASISPLGRCYIIQEQPDDWDINESVFSICPKQEIVSSEYLYCYLISQWFIKKAEKEATGSIFAGIRMASLNAMPINIPDENTMKRITANLKPLFQQKEKLVNEISHLTALRDELLPLLMNGQVKVE